jgi:hypothetical protein
VRRARLEHCSFDAGCPPVDDESADILHSITARLWLYNIRSMALALCSMGSGGSVSTCTRSCTLLDTLDILSETEKTRRYALRSLKVLAVSTSLYCRSDCACQISSRHMHRGDPLVAMMHMLCAISGHGRIRIPLDLLQMLCACSRA